MLIDDVTAILLVISNAKKALRVLPGLARTTLVIVRKTFPTATRLR
jgi:hypothetical protein